MCFLTLRRDPKLTKILLYISFSIKSFYFFGSRGERHPLCGTQVNSRIERTVIPRRARPRIAASRALLKPRITISTCLILCFRQYCATCSPAVCAAKGVRFRRPLKGTSKKLTNGFGWF